MASGSILAGPTRSGRKDHSSFQAQNQPVHLFAAPNTSQLAQEMPSRRIRTTLIVILRGFLVAYLRLRNECVMGPVNR